MEKLRLIIFQSGEGESFLLQYMNSPYPINVLIDGGVRETFSTALYPFLNNNYIAPTLNLVIASHTDNDHIGGLVALLEDIKEKKEENIDERYIIKIDDLWHNTFRFIREDMSKKSQQPLEQVSNELISIQQGIRLEEIAREIPITINRQFGGSNIILSMNPIDITKNLRFYTIGPSQENLERLEEEWRKRTQYAAVVDPSLFNRSSIIVFIEVKVGKVTKRLLFTGDGRADDIEKGLEDINKKGKDEPFNLDILKVPHHGSERSVDKSFFTNIKAKYYIISGKGEHHPSKQTLDWIIDSVPEAFIIVTNVNDAVEQSQREHRNRIIPLKDYYHPLDIS